MMPCPECGMGSAVLSTRPSLHSPVTRRHECLGAKHHRFTTFEILDISQTARALIAQRLANRGFTQEAIDNILDL